MDKPDNTLLLSVIGLVIAVAGFVVVSVCWGIKLALLLVPVAVLNACKMAAELRKRSTGGQAHTK